MKTICITKKSSNEIIACVPLSNGEKGIIHKDYEIQFYDGTEPCFVKSAGEIKLSGNVFGIRL